jgi:hypothetical protein
VDPDGQTPDGDGTLGKDNYLHVRGSLSAALEALSHLEAVAKASEGTDAGGGVRGPLGEQPAR